MSVNGSNGEGVRGTLILGLLVAILGLMLASIFWPRPTTLTTESLQAIEEVAVSMKASADNWDKIAKASASMNEALMAQARGSRDEANAIHQRLLDRYQAGPGPFNDYANSLLEQSDGYGGGDLPRGEGSASPDQQLQESDDRAKTEAHVRGSRATYDSDRAAGQLPQ